MHGYGVDGWEWFWMSLMMGIWVILLGLAVYIAFRLAHGDRHGKIEQ